MNSQHFPEDQLAHQVPLPRREEPSDRPDIPDIQPADMTLLQSASSTPPLQPYTFHSAPTAVIADTYYEREDEEPDELGMGSKSGPMASPFQLSSPLPVVRVDAASAPGTGPSSISPPGNSGTAKGRKSLPRIVRMGLILVLVAAAFGFLWFTVFAQPAQMISSPSGVSQTRGSGPATSPATPSTGIQRNQPMKPIPVPTALPSSTSTPQTGTMQNATWVPQQLPAGWTNAGLTVGDALFAERTAVTFTDREEGIDYRDVGSRMQHAGTLTASTFLLTPGGRDRFFQNDVRVINNVFFDHIESVQLVQTAVNEVPSLVSFQTQGQTQVALIDVSYQLFQSQLDPQQQRRLEGIELDPATNQPRIHHMSVLLVRVMPGTQGANAPMGGTGWLVSNYGLDVPAAMSVGIVQPV